MLSSLTQIPGIGPVYQKRLEKLGIFTPKDLLLHYPSRFLDFSVISPINQLQIKKSASFSAKIGSPASFYSKSGKYITIASASDKTGQVSLIWFNSHFIKSLIKPNSTYTIAGTPTFFNHQLAIFAPQIERSPGQALKGAAPATNSSGHRVKGGSDLNGLNLHTQGFVPIYPLTRGVSSKWLRSKISLCLKLLHPKENLPSSVLKKYRLPTNKLALQHIHFPPELKSHDLADKRLSFNHHLQINLRNLKEQAKKAPAIKIAIDSAIHKLSLKKLPFKLTPDQEKAVGQGFQDLQKTSPGRRLIHGDTGSGKTAILILLANQCLNSRSSFVILTPTQVLAEQHADTFKKMSLFPRNIQLITASSKPKIKNQPTVYIGTHALLNRLPANLKYPVAVLAIDEQHKFGVKQRQTLLNRNPSPHIINLSATPIPRTVALGLFGETKISVIKHKPQNRKPVKTWVMDQNRLSNGRTWLKKRLEEGNKILVVCPNIKSSKSTASIEEIFPQYQKNFGANYEVLSLHGKISNHKRKIILNQFKKLKEAILVATPLIEVGLDIPNANIILIHSADRFGLAQLHQLRGRVGRGGRQGYCLVIPSTPEQQSIERLQLLSKHSSGLTLAKLDLKLRGAGEMFGKKQHGRLPVRLKHFWDKHLFQQAKQQAKLQLKREPSSLQAIVTHGQNC